MVTYTPSLFAANCFHSIDPRSLVCRHKGSQYIHSDRNPSGGCLTSGNAHHSRRAFLRAEGLETRFRSVLPLVNERCLSS